MASCEKCWSDAHSYDDVTARYIELIEERKDNQCSPEEQAGIDANICRKCGRKTVHQYIHVCMNCN